MMFTKAEQRQIADKIVNFSLKIGQKDNPHYLEAIKHYPWMHHSFTVKQAQLDSRLTEREILNIVREYSDPLYGPVLVKHGSVYEPKRKVGHNVDIKYHPDSRELAHEIRKACWKNGANVFWHEQRDEYVRDQYALMPENSLVEVSPVDAMLSERLDFMIHLETRDWAEWSHGIPVQKIKASAAAKNALHEIQDRRHLRWLLVGWPHKIAAKKLGIKQDRFEKIMRSCIITSFKPASIARVERYHKAFEGSGDIRITADDGTDLTFSVRGRRADRDLPFFRDDDIAAGEVGMNIPSGEVFFAPIETSANGVIAFKRAVIPGQGVAHQLRLTFKDGRVVKIAAKKGAGYLPAFLKQNSEDANVIAEFGIGLNDQAEFTGGEIIIDEKILGSIHVAIGWNKGFGGRTNASSHLDFIKDLRNCNGRVYADGKLMIDKGEPVF